MVRQLTIWILSLCISTAVFGQYGIEYMFSQYYSASLYLNPAFAGIYSSPNLSVNYRQQTPGGNFKQQSMQASFVFPIVNQNDFDSQIGGIGISGYSQQRGISGVEKVNGFMLSYAHDLRFSLISPDLLAFGLQAGMQFVGVNYSSLEWGSMYSPFISSGVNPNAGAPEDIFDDQGNNLMINAGVIYYYNRERNYLLYNYSAFSGFSATNLNRPNASLSEENEFIPPIMYRYHGAFEFRIQGIYLMPSILMTYHNKDFQFNGGAYVSYPTSVSRGYSLDSRGLELIAGAWYRLQDSFIFILGFNDDQIGARVSYDLNQDVILPGETIQNIFPEPAFEISIQYNLSGSNRMRRVSNPLF